MQSRNDPLLTELQILHLAEIVLGEYGCDLRDDDLAEQIGLLLEDVAGFEAEPDSIVQDTIKTIRSKYYELGSD